MTAGVHDRAELDRVRALVRSKLGIELEAGDGERDGLAGILDDRIRETGTARLGAYVSLLTSPATARAELRALSARITVGETYFFRNQDQLRAFREAALPDRLRARDARRDLRILSAGCASGEEAYTLAMIVGEVLRDPASWRVTIRGIDINASLLERARCARYSRWSLRQVPDTVRDRYFRADGHELVLDPAVRGMVSFEERNLVDEDPAFWRPDAFDVIFFRNVAIYLSAEATRAAVARFARALAPGGFLFLGDAETLRNVSLAFHLRQTHGAFYYQLREDGFAPPPAPLVAEALPAELVETSASWVDAITRASDRIATLVRSEETPTPAVEARAPRPSSLALVSELVQKERFGDALELLTTLPPDAARDADVQLLRAAVLTNRGEVAEAERVCELVLELDELNAGAHYLKALCREHAGDRAAAAEHDRAAAYLDPTFAMPHLHLGLLARRGGDHAGARTSIGRALDLLAREDASRILLFGGGFNRDALVLLCRAELQACGGVA